MYYNKVEICGVNTSHLKVLSDEEKRELLLRAREGDEAARQELINGNLRLVLSIVQRFSGRKESMDDLFQVGCIGLVKAVDNFNVELEVKFSTYAVPMIIGEIRRYLRDNNSIRVSRSVRDLAYKALSVREDLLKNENGEPSISRICKEL
jgi:RNA polymerase sporulation-specific sigma factor